jgi:hypothetical protein
MRLMVRIDAKTGDVIVESEKDLVEPRSPARRPPTFLPEVPGIPTDKLAEVRRIIETVAEAFELKPEWIRKQNRVQVVVLARHMAMWFARRRTDLSYPLLAKAFDRHHTTVIDALQSSGESFEPGGSFAEITAQVEARLDAQRDAANAPVPPTEMIIDDY